MEREFHELVMEENGFRKIARIEYEFKQEMWWHPEDKINISIIRIKPNFVIKGTKTYVMKSISQEGETYIRDLAMFHDYLESHFQEMHISFSYFRDIDSQNLILQRIKDKKQRNTGESGVIDLSQKNAELEEIKNRFVSDKAKIEETESLLSLTKGKSSLLNSYLKAKARNIRSELKELQDDGRKLEREIFLNYKLLKEYRKKGAGAAFLFSISSNLQACERESLQDALSNIVKEIKDIHHFQIRQKLFGGKLNIHVEEISHPILAYQIEWAGGALNPRQLAKLGPHFDELRKCVEDYLMVLPTKDIIVDGSIKDEKKLFSAKALQNFFLRLDKVPSVSVPKDLPKDGGWIGNIMIGDDITDIPFFYPIKLNHGYISGTTRAGKSYLARIIVENSLLERVNVIIFDPTMQWSGLVKPASEKSILKRFDRIGISRDYARGFKSKIYIPESDLGEELPVNLSILLKGSSIINMKYCDDQKRCQIALDILKTVYNSLLKETDNLVSLIVLEEAHAFLPGNVTAKAKETAKEVRILINKIAREKAKYGCNFLFISQSLSDFKAEAKIVREMINSRFFLRASDRIEMEYVQDFISKDASQTVKNLKQGEVLVHGYATSAPSGIKVYVRPPFSHVGELSDREIEEVINNNEHMTLSGQNYRRENSFGDIRNSNYDKLTWREKEALKIIKEYFRMHEKPITAIDLGNKMGLQGGSRQRLIDGLVEKGLVETTTMHNMGRGRPIQGITPSL